MIILVWPRLTRHGFIFAVSVTLNECQFVAAPVVPLSTFPILFFLPYIPVFTTVSLWIRSSASHQSSIYYRHLFFNNIPLANSGLLTFLVFISCLFLFRPSFPSFALFPQLHSFSILVDFFSKSLITYEFLPRCTSFAFWASSHFSTCLLLLL